MHTIVIGGHSRNIGKTSVVANIVRALPEFGWTAVKVTQFGHGVCSVNGKACHCSTDEHLFTIEEERHREGRADTCRYLQAGARRSLWVRTKQGLLWAAMPALTRTLADDRYVIMESNSILQFIKPDLYLTVLDYTKTDFKDSARRYLDRADAYLVLETGASHPVWKDIPFQPVSDRPIFPLSPGRYISEPIIDLVRRTLLK